MANPPPPIPNFFTNRNPWTVILFGGAPVKAALTEINGVSTEDAWQKQKSKETSGQVAVFQGTTWGDPELVFEATDDADFDDLRALWERLAPVPGSHLIGTSTAKGTTYGIGSPAKGDSAASSGSGGSNFAIPNNEPSKVPSVGPRPPTVPVQYPLLAWHGITAVARKKWEGPTPTETNGLQVKLSLLADKPPQPAGTGVMGPPGSRYSATGGGSSGGASGGGAANAINGAAAAGAAGT